MTQRNNDITLSCNCRHTYSLGGEETIAEVTFTPAGPDAFHVSMDSIQDPADQPSPMLIPGPLNWATAGEALLELDDYEVNPEGCSVVVTGVPVEFEAILARCWAHNWQNGAFSVIKHLWESDILQIWKCTHLIRKGRRQPRGILGPDFINTLEAFALLLRRNSIKEPNLLRLGMSFQVEVSDFDSMSLLLERLEQYESTTGIDTLLPAAESGYAVDASLLRIAWGFPSPRNPATVARLLCSWVRAEDKPRGVFTVSGYRDSASKIPFLDWLFRHGLRKPMQLLARERPDDAQAFHEWVKSQYQSSNRLVERPPSAGGAVGLMIQRRRLDCFKSWYKVTRQVIKDWGPPLG